MPTALALLHGMLNMYSVFIVDDHPVIRLAIRMLLENQGYTIVGESDNGVDAMQMIREARPDLVIYFF